MAQETLEVVYATGVRTSGLLLGEEQSISKECTGGHSRYATQRAYRNDNDDDEYHV